MTTLPVPPQIAILIDTRIEWGRNIVKGILAHARNAGHWHVWVRPLALQNFDALPNDRTFHGIIAHVNTPEIAEKLKGYNLPIVNVADTPVPDFSAPCVRTDDRVSTRMAAEFFIARGFRNIALAGPLQRPNPANYHQMFKKNLAGHGLSCSTFEQESLDSSALTAWLHSLPKPVGILTWGHTTGRCIVDCCATANIEVPHDVAVLSGGYDELLSYACHPPLSGILTPTEQIGCKSAELLHQMMRGQNVSHETILIPPLGIKELGSTDTLAVEDPALVPLIGYLQEHAFEAITMDDILKIIPMSRRTLERRYFKAFGRSPFDEIRLLRINHARKLLVETDKPMQLIAEACGYTTYNYLAQVFKQVTGMSPSAYRKKMQRH